MEKNNKPVHPKIQTIIESLSEMGLGGLDKETLFFLNTKNVTQTEAVAALYFGFDVSIEAADSYVRQSGILPGETIDEVAYQTFLYMFYDPQKPDSDAESVAISI
jgi:hypothetical protein